MKIPCLLIFSILHVGASFAGEIPTEGMSVWLKNESLAGEQVETWTDSSGGINHAIQRNTRARPTIDRSGKFPVVLLDGGQRHLRLPKLRLGHEMTVFIVAFDTSQSGASSVHHALLAADNDPFHKDGDGYGFSYHRSDRDGFTIVLSDGKNWHHLRDWSPSRAREAFEILTFLKEGDHGTLFRNGSFAADREFGRTPSQDFHTGYVLGDFFNGRTYLGKVAEVIIYDRPLTDRERLTVQEYLARKFDLHLAAEPVLKSKDARFFPNGTLIYSNGYNDQPSIVIADNGDWLCLLTTAAKEENDKDRHMVLLRSKDQGKTWVKSETTVEPPAEMRQPSWGTLFKIPGGRIYAFYILNPTEPKQPKHYAGRFSDDHGATWSERFYLPVRETEINREFRGQNTGFWGIDRPISMENGETLIPFSKYGGSDRHGEGFIMASPNLLTERDPAKIQWEMNPPGERGVRSEDLGDLQEEHTIEPIGPQSFYSAFRTRTGYLGEFYGKDAGKSWEEPRFATYVDGRRIKHPRACPMVWSLGADRFLLWFHNHDGRSSQPERNKDRNPGWLAAATLKEGRLHWSQPEPAVFSFKLKHNSGMSYPDLIQHDGRFLLATTDKVDARLIEIPPKLIEGLLAQETLRAIPSEGLLLDWRRGKPLPAAAPALPSLAEDGFSISVTSDFEGVVDGTILVDSRNAAGHGIALRRVKNSVQLEIHDGRLGRPEIWASDTDSITPGKINTTTFTVDGAANLVYVLTNGLLNDGGEDRQFGWGHISHEMDEIPTGPLKIHPSVSALQIFGRPLSTSESVGLDRALRTP